MENKIAPVFVKLDEYKDLVNIMTVIKRKISESRETLLKLNQLKTEEQSELDSWNQNLDDVAKKVEFIENMLVQPKF